MSSSLRFVAVTAALAGMRDACVATFARRRESARTHVEGLGDLPDSELVQLATYARGHAEGAVRAAYDAGVAAGRAQVREELGLPVEREPGAEDPTQRLGHCPLAPSRLCDEPAKRAPTLPYGRKP